MKRVHPNFLLSSDSVLVVIDIQEKLFSTMSDKSRQNVLKNMPILLSAAKELELPIVVTEQYPKGIGPTIPELQEGINSYPNIAKVDFASTEVDDFVETIAQTGKRKLILTGMETHICVYQTALGLLQLGYQVHLVKDAIASRLDDNLEIGVGLIQDAGGLITCTEAVLFQLLERAGTESFKKLQKLII